MIYFTKLLNLSKGAIIVDLLEAKKFEYFFKDQESRFQKLLKLQYKKENDYQNKITKEDDQKEPKYINIPAYTILWESNNELFFCNTYSEIERLDYKLDNKNKEKYYLWSNFDGSYFNNLNIKMDNLWEILKEKLSKSSGLNLLINSVAFFDYILREFNKFNEYNDFNRFNGFNEVGFDPYKKDIDQTTIFNVQKFNSAEGATLDFLKVEDGFTLKPVSLIENKDKEEQIELK